MFDYLEFFFKPLSEAKLGRTSDGTDSFESLPQHEPYGFVVLANGKFAVVEDWGSHMDMAQQVGSTSMDAIVAAGGIRMAISKMGEGDMYIAEYWPTKATNRAKKTAKDLANHYQKQIVFEKMPVGFEPLSEIDLTEDYPTAWNKNEFEKISSFAGKMRYANSHLQKIASGSGRTVFKIDDKKVLKLAKNKKGLAQNGVESEAYLQNYDIVARTFDKDYDHSFWVEMELAKKIGQKRFSELTGVNIGELGAWLRYEKMGLPKHPGRTPEDAAYREKMDNNEFIGDLLSLMADYDMPSGDLGRLSSYGEVVRDGKPKLVLVDFGLTQSVFDDFYKVG